MKDTVQNTRQRVSKTSMLWVPPEKAEKTSWGLSLKCAGQITSTGQRHFGVQPEKFAHPSLVSLLFEGFHHFLIYNTAPR